MERNPVGWFEIYVSDIERAQTFYETVFAVKLEDMVTPGEDDGTNLIMKSFPMTEGMDGAGAPGALCKMDGNPGGGSSTIVYFSSADCAVEEGRVESAGGTVMKPKMSIGEYGFVSLVTDTEGNVIGIHSMR